MHGRANENDPIHQQAEAFLESSQVPEELAWAHMIMGISHERTLDWLAAADSYSKGLALSPRDPHVQYYCNNNLGSSLIQLGRFEEAGPYCNSAIAIYRKGSINPNLVGMV